MIADASEPLIEPYGHAVVLRARYSQKYKQGA